MKVEKIKLVPPVPQSIIKIELTETEARWLYALTGSFTGISPARSQFSDRMWWELEKVLGEWEDRKQEKFNKELPNNINLTRCGNCCP